MLQEGGAPQEASQDCAVSGSGHKHFDLIFPVVLLCKQKQVQHQPVFHRPYLQGWKSPWSQHCLLYPGGLWANKTCRGAGET